jgi:hypothetical protein
MPHFLKKCQSPAEAGLFVYSDSAFLIWKSSRNIPDRNFGLLMTTIFMMVSLPV